MILISRNVRLNANRMLRLRKVLFHIAEGLPDEAIPNGYSRGAPEQWLELLCKGEDNPVSLQMTLATLKSLVWRQSTDIAITYRLISEVQDNNSKDVD